jgi:hypothetical protein
VRRWKRIICYGLDVSGFDPRPAPTNLKGANEMKHRMVFIGVWALSYLAGLGFGTSMALLPVGSGALCGIELIALLFPFVCVMSLTQWEMEEKNIHDR